MGETTRRAHPQQNRARTRFLREPKNKWVPERQTRGDGDDGVDDGDDDGDVDAGGHMVGVGAVCVV